MMYRKYFMGFVVVLLALVLAGCSRSVSRRVYIEDRPRVDQEMEGNFGYLSGTPVPEDRSNFKKTRRYYVLELTEEPEVEKELTDKEEDKIEKEEDKIEDKLEKEDDKLEKEDAKDKDKDSK